jgi:UDP-2-acetamido-3-amino-2,3-dideoxy-glucuronate N-acetyltransferase
MADPGYYRHESAYVDDGALVGAGTKIWHFSHVVAGARIGERCTLGQNVYVGNVVVGHDCKIQNNVSVYDGVTLEEFVFVGPSVVFTNVINPRAEIVRKSEYKPTLVRRGATIGANATILCGNTINEYAFVAAGAVVNRDVGAYSLVAGVPAVHKGWMCRCGHQLRGDVLTCRMCGAHYRLDGQTLVSA